MAGTTKLMTAGGGGVNIQPASSIASDVTVNVPSQNCTLGIQGPAFSAYRTVPQSLSQNTDTLCQVNVVEFDTASRYNNTGSTVNGIPAYSFMPNVAGYYQINFGAYGISSTGTSLVIATLYKNNNLIPAGTSGTAYVYGGGTSYSDGSSHGSDLVYLNGTTDYINFAVRVFGSGTASSASQRFSAVLVRSA